MSSPIAVSNPDEWSRATHLTRNIAHKVTCVMALEAIRDATNTLLLQPSERAKLDQAIKVLEVNRDHYTNLLERLANYG